MTSNLNPMFQPYRSTPQIIKSEQSNNPKPRKKRKDAKKDTKIPLSIEQKKFVRLISFTHRKDVTPFVSALVMEGLKKEYIEYCTEEEEYHSESEENVHCKLSQPQYDYLHSLSIEWNVPIRRACHRILFFMLKTKKK